MPSKVLLDSPFPENLPVVGSCLECNHGFSKDEEYLACLMQALIDGTTDPAMMSRKRIRASLERSPPLRARIDAALKLTPGPELDAERARITKVLLKLARGHAAFELSRAFTQEPSMFWWSPLSQLSAEALNSFEDIVHSGPLGEVGSRNSQRLMVMQLTLRGPDGSLVQQGFLANDWVDVQDERYRYFACEAGGKAQIRIVVGEYLACYASWD